MASAPRRLGFRAAALLLGALVALLVCELALRASDLPSELERRARSFDPVFAHVRKDSWVFDFAIDPRRHHAVELRGQLIALDKPEGTTRVLFLGDSATEGAFVALEQAYPHAFKTLLDAHSPGHGVEVINAGVWGMTTIDAYYLLEQKLLPLQPDVVVLGVFLANDINWNLGHPQRELRYAAPRLLDRARQTSALAQFLFLQALHWNERWQLLPRAELGRELVPVELSLIDEHGLHMLSYPAGELALYVRPESALVGRAWALFRDVLERFVELGRARGFRLRVLMIPSPSSTLAGLHILRHPNLLNELRAQGIAIDRAQLDFAQPLRRGMSICRELELSCVDPSARLRPLGLSAFFAGDEHPSVEGHRALARALWESR